VDAAPAKTCINRNWKKPGHAGQHHGPPEGRFIFMMKRHYPHHQAGLPLRMGQNQLEDKFWHHRPLPATGMLFRGQKKLFV